MYCYCSTCEKELKKNEDVISINLQRDTYHRFYLFCSDECKEEMYLDKEEGGEPSVPYVEFRYKLDS